MKHPIRKTAALGLMILLAAACTKDIEYKGPDSKPMLVMNCIVQDGEVPVIHVSRSVFFLDFFQSRKSLDDRTTVDVEINGESRHAAWDTSEQVYTDGRTVHAGDIVHITASHPDYPGVSATDTVPVPSECIITGFRKQYSPRKTIGELFDDIDPSFDDSRIDSTWVVEIEIDDLKDHPDYYFLTIMPTISFVTDHYEGGPLDTVTVPLHYQIPAKTKILLDQSDAATSFLEETESDDEFKYGQESFIFPDQHIKDGSRLTFEILMERPDTVSGIIYTTDSLDYYSGYGSYDPYYYSNYLFTSGQIYGDLVYSANVVLHTLSSSYYFYHKSTEDFEDAEMTLMSEPVTVISNVKGGAGILGAYSSRKYTKTIKAPF
ncbi:MAG: DUF4249 domain-containing protein [Bacteroidaceae bacterium]|nr:DUF4249 domain-containing protein [Bacteroidaceae bacterium]